MSYEIRGRVERILDKQTFASGFEKQTLVLQVEDKYPQSIPFDFIKDRTDLLNKVQRNDDVLIKFNIQGNEYNGRYYCSLTAWYITVESKSNPEPQPESRAESQPEPDDDIPF